jgi:hypothetical protein
MNESHFESSLRAFRPSTPPAAIEARIAAGLSDSEPSRAKKEREPVSIRFEQARESLLIRCFHNLGWAIAGAASAVAVIALCPQKPAPEKHETHETSDVRIAAPLERRNLSSAPSAGAGSPATPVSFVPMPASLPAGSGETNDFQTVETTRELISTEEEGQVLYRNGNSPMRQVRSRYREHHAWTNPRTGARVDIEIPREDVFLKPVSLQ